ncbi:TPM domain-containing protein [Leptolyngbya sp. Cla-17]|uniref:TPM domain-containing protein n=1 Tax=Leptolyngbya sp. Cla-17 TaxID=2803751 RepID=UPI0018D91EC1|nr:TPM domain-containing protein [Leptolyngbya sp. Cla-17]
MAQSELITGMQYHRRFSQKWLVYLFSSLVALSIWLSPVGLFASSSVAYAFDNPDLLPKTDTAVIDLAKFLSSDQEAALAEDLAQFQQTTGWKLKVLTQFDRTPGTAVKGYWGLDDHSVLLVADPRGGNILNFSVGDDFYPLMPRVFWIELQTRFGNQFYVRENGEDQAILGAIGSIKTCLLQGGCQVVPGLPQEQWILTLITSILGGVICGFAAHPRKEGQVFSWQWALIFSPLWGILFIAFGIGPVVTRTSDWLPLFRNVAGFLIGALVAYLTPMLNRSSPSET